MLTIKMFYNDVFSKVCYELEWERHSDARRSRLYTIREMLLAHAPLVGHDGATPPCQEGSDRSSGNTTTTHETPLPVAGERRMK